MNTELSKAETERIMKPFSVPSDVRLKAKWQRTYGSGKCILCGLRGKFAYTKGDACTGHDDREWETYDKLQKLCEPQPLTVVRHTYPSSYFLAGIFATGVAAGVGIDLLWRLF